MVISVVIATHNRIAHLKKALESLAIQRLHQNEYEVLVVDNASTDGTKEEVEHFAQKHAFVKYIHENAPGANFARNTGWKNAQGKYIAFMDDDAVADSQWLASIVSCFESIRPQPAIVGGKVLPIWESAKPSWIEGKLLTALSVVDYGEQPRFLKDHEYFFSVNMAFRKELLAAFGGFDVSLGRVGQVLTSNDEILVAKKIRKAGGQFYYDPTANVMHHISANRLTMHWFKKRYYLQGYSECLMWYLVEKPSQKERFSKLLTHCYYFVRNPKYVFRLFAKPADYENLYKKLIAYSWLGFMKGVLTKPTAK
jgi:glycosyltransferase involved in cell wall biosynthesis